MKRAATPSPPASQKRSKNQSNNQGEFDPIDEGNGWEQTGPNEWTNKFTNECTDFKPTYPAAQQEGASLDLNRAQQEGAGMVQHDPGMVQMNFAPQTATPELPQNTTLNPQYLQEMMAKQERQQREQAEQQRQIHHQRWQQADQMQQTYANHLVNNNRANLLRACVQEHAERLVFHYNTQTGNILTAVQMLDPEFIPNYVNSLSSAINSKGDASQPVDLMDMLSSSDEGSDEGGDNEGEENEVEKEERQLLRMAAMNNGNNDQEQIPSDNNGVHQSENVEKDAAGSQDEPLVLSDDDNDDDNEEEEEDEEEEPMQIPQSNSIDESSSAGLAI